ncbi:hypothetical protein ACXJY6_07505 [Vibrio sp. RC27]
MKLASTLLISLIAWQSHASDINELQRLAAQRDPLAQYQLAVTYQQGTGVEPSIQKAQYWFEQASELGSIPAQKELIKLYLTDTPSSQELQEALYWLSLHAVKGNHDDAIRLGEFYSQYGDRIASIDQSIAWYRIAAIDSEAAEEQYNALLQAKFDGKRLQRVQQLEQLSETLSLNSEETDKKTGDPINQTNGIAHTDIITISAIAIFALITGSLKIRSRKKRIKQTGQQRQKQDDLSKQLKSSQRTVERQKQQMSKIVKQYKKLQQSQDKKPSANQQQLEHACVLFGCSSKAIPDEKQLKLRYRQLSKIYHPDAGGTDSAMTNLNHSLKLLVTLKKAQQARKSRIQ